MTATILTPDQFADAVALINDKRAAGFDWDHIILSLRVGFGVSPRMAKVMICGWIEGRAQVRR